MTIAIPTLLLLPAWLLTGVALWVALRHADYTRLKDFEAQAVYAGVLAMAVAARLARVEIAPGLDLHLACASLAALMFGWRFAVLLQAAAVVIVALLAGRWWLDPALDFLLTGLLPVLVTTGLLDLAQRRLPLHLFVYLLGNAFFGAGLAMAVSQVGKLAILWALAVHPLPVLAENFLLTLPAMMFPEGFATGGLITLLVAYRPHWVATFHDFSYLGSAEEPKK
jgi:uncharacterized membrane protein